ncbi:unnamed protein product, partial [Rangifer tarandus platyrhynchus]|uniref:Uncharacterized protein n=1 Tax=Rangifer tarandus platyrhynchus TaxID=3082113 RepID=A0AC59ZLG8_RANTA
MGPVWGGESGPQLKSFSALPPTPPVWLESLGLQTLGPPLNLPRASRSGLPWRGGGGGGGGRGAARSGRGEEGAWGLPRSGRSRGKRKVRRLWWVWVEARALAGVAGQFPAKAAGQSGEGRAAEQREPAAELSPRPAFPGATATALSPPPLQSVAASPRARAPRRQRLGARAPSPGRRRGARAREPRRGSCEGGRGRAEGGAGRRGRERRARESRGEREQRASAGERRGRERRERATRTQRHTVTGIPL